MNWNDEALNQLAAALPCGYHPKSAPSCEPTALAAIALSTAHRPAGAAVEWLAGRQAADGSVSAGAQADAKWPTGWAILAALAESRIATRRDQSAKFDIARATRWILQTTGDSAAAVGEKNVQTSAPSGWPWVNGTYSWVEPTAIQIVALKATGYSSHAATREGVAMLVDRLLNNGGCNYGNTVVLGQELRPHLQPTGLAMLALAGEAIGDVRIERSLNYLASTLSASTPSTSLAYGLIGLAAHDRVPNGAPNWLQAAYGRTASRDGSAYKFALLSLASRRTECPLVNLMQQRGL